MTIHRTTTRPRRRPLIAALAVPGLAIAVAACSSGTTTGHQVANLPGGSRHQGGAAQFTLAQGDQHMVSYARCMRAHGVPMRDPFRRPGHAGLTIELPPPTAASRPAEAECNHFIQPIEQMKNAGAEAMFASLLPALTRYAQCMRGHDIAMLDPAPEGQLNLGAVPGITGDFGRTSPQFRAADTACRHFLPVSVHDDGTGP